MDDLMNGAATFLALALALTACERNTDQFNPPFLTCNPERTACASSIIEATP